jgi:hypothetical protein
MVGSRDERWWKHCAGCGDRIGIYEPIWVEHPDNGTVRSSYLNLAAFERPQTWRAWHVDCLTPENDPS